MRNGAQTTTRPEVAALCAALGSRLMWRRLPRVLSGVARGDGSCQAVVLDVAAPALVAKVTALTGQLWQPEVEVAVDLLLASVAEDLCSLATGSRRHLQPASAAQVRNLLEQVAAAAVSVQSMWLV